MRSELGDRGYLAFGAILLIWELLPTSLLILIFRVRRPTQEVFTSETHCTTSQWNKEMKRDDSGFVIAIAVEVKSACFFFLRLYFLILTDQQHGHQQQGPTSSIFL